LIDHLSLGFHDNEHHPEAAKDDPTRQKTQESFRFFAYDLRFHEQDVVSAKKQAAPVRRGDPLKRLLAVEENVLPGLRYKIPPIAILAGVDARGNHEDLRINGKEFLELVAGIYEVFGDFVGELQIRLAEIRAGEPRGIRRLCVFVGDETIEAVISQEPAQEAVAPTKVDYIAQPESFRHDVGRPQISEVTLGGSRVDLVQIALICFLEPVWRLGLQGLAALALEVSDRIFPEHQ